MLFDKQAQYSSALLPGNRGLMVEDLIREVRRDMTLNPSQQMQAIQAIQASGGTHPKRPVSSLAAGVAGGVLANVSGKYFGMSPVGRMIATVAGVGFGQQVNNRLGGITNRSGWT